ncbi:MAG: M24 family metallopeptidase [Clostridiales Family XIII bacterium]|jgi:Xaa-Pro aminopeptidase|nr:M24 family metallopeptidase [Clostridiales Family XIII bacterium]
MENNRVIMGRLAALRDAMRAAGLDAYLVFDADTVGSESPAERFLTRTWLTGFDGSAGCAVITANEARLWTDGRYWLQAEKQLAGTGIELMRSGKAGVPKPEEFLAAALHAGDAVGVCGETFPAAEYDGLAAALQPQGIAVRATEDLFEKLWTVNRPEMPTGEIFLLEDAARAKGAGAATGAEDMHRGTVPLCDFVYNSTQRNRPPVLNAAARNLAAVRAELKKRGADYALITDLASVAWLFGFRGSDILCTPVAYARALVSQSDAILFIDNAKVPADVLSSLEIDGVAVRDFGGMEHSLRGLAPGTRLTYDPDTVSAALRNSLAADITRIEAPDPVLLLKSLKTDEEIGNLRRCHERDGRVMVRFLIWLEESAGKITEYDAAGKLTELRAEDPLSLGDSFEPICAYGANGAIVHYHAEPDSAAVIGERTYAQGDGSLEQFCIQFNTVEPSPCVGGRRTEPDSAAGLGEAGFFVTDSGGQYVDGTTDITRTVLLGDSGDSARRDYTLVLKAHIALASVEFRHGVAGAHLDALPRRVLWREGVDYAHGTGHGVGYVLGVHETPPGFTSSANAGSGARTPIEPNMVFSNEPGLYRAGAYGIRIENLVTPYVSRENEFGRFLKLETLSLCPIDLTPVIAEMLTIDEIEWLNAYHREVYARLAPGLTETERRWLASRTREISTP